ncbi:MAG TPA: hypothetical protein VK927_05430 [Adhaeribacter sp.]|nr:hypothetical protein [Adhaeribacter sp.]
MYVPFEELDPQSRIWIYQADREFTEAEAAAVEEKLKAFAAGWCAHGAELHASATLLHRRFIVLGTDTNIVAPSGCSIDSSSQFVRELEEAFGVTLFDRTHLAFKIGNEVKVVPLTEMPVAVKAGEVTAETPYFDNVVGEAAALKNDWLKPAGQTWLRKYFS